MPVEITMPQLSDTMSEGTVVKWLKKEGDQVKAGEIIAEIETDKATMEMEAFESGTLAVIAAKEGEKVKVGGRIAMLASAGETADQVKKGAGAPKAAAAESSEPKKESSTATATATAAPPAPTPSVSASIPAKRENGDAGRMRISPLARRMAESKGIDASQIRGSGPAGRIIRRDVESVSGASAPARRAAAPMPARVGSGEKQIIELTKIRTTIAQRLQQSKQQLPHFYETIDIDVEDVAALRASMNKKLADQGVKLSIGDFVAKAVALALVDHPQLNAHFTGSQITRFGDVNLGMAVALPEGLIVPVLRNINQMDLKEIRIRSAELVERARAQKLKGDELTGATFTVSNLGSYGVEEFSAIINPPEVGILAVAAAEKRPVVRGDSIVARMRMKVTLSADHRAVDGAGAADFLRTLKQYLEEPGMMLV